MLGRRRGGDEETQKVENGTIWSDSTVGSNPRIIACIPAFNEEKTIAKVVIKAQKHADVVLVCDDGSSDMTAEIAEKLGAVVLRHERNLGKGEALRTLFAHVLQLGADMVVTLDADGQHDPNEIPELTKPIADGEADLVIGSRFVKGASTDMPSYRMAGTKMINWLSGNRVKDAQSGFRAFSRKALGIVAESETKGYGIEEEELALAIKNDLRIVEVPIAVRYGGLDKTSKKGPIPHGMELISTAIRLVVEERPILMLGVPGFMFLVVGLLSGTYLVWYFNVTRYFSVPMALTTLGAVLVGMTLIVAALVLYSLNRIVARVLKR